MVVPDLLQTRRYARADIEASHPSIAEDQLGRRVDVRLARQGLLDAERLPRLLVILDESTLHRSVGGDAVMAEQLRHLVSASERTNVTVQVLQFDRAGPAGLRTGFTLLSFDDYEADTVYVDGLLGDGQVERPEELPQAGTVFARLQEQALSPGESVRYIEATAKSRW